MSPITKGYVRLDGRKMPARAKRGSHALYQDKTGITECESLIVRVSAAVGLALILLTLVSALAS